MPRRRFRPPRPALPPPAGPLGPNEWRQVEPLPGQQLTSVTIRVDSDVLVHARMRALLEGTNVSRLVRSMLEAYAADSLRRFRADPEAFVRGERRGVSLGERRGEGE